MTWYAQYLVICASGSLDIQSINLIENRDFRDLLLMLRDTLCEQDIPHRTKIQCLIIDAWTAYHFELKAELGVSGHNPLNIS